MVINENNTHINSFTKGMNSDIAYDLILNSQYTYGKNIRITKNQSLGGASDYSALQEGIVTPVPDGKLIGWIENFDDGVILDVKSVDNIGTIITTDESNSLIVWRVVMNTESTPESFKYKVVWKSEGFFGDTEKQVSSVLYKELDNVIKLYIATGVKPIIELRVDDDAPSYGPYEDGKYRDVDYLINNRIIPKDRVYINSVIGGRLPASLVQYTYRFYNKYGNTTQLAPLTNKIQIIDSSRDKETGNAEGTETARGLQLSIPVTSYAGLFERMLVFRLTFTKPNTDSEISLIYDDKIKGDPFILNDVGIEPLLTLTIEEFSAMSGLILVPKHIENNQNYMFCANVQDDTIIKDLHIERDYDNTIEYIEPVYTEVVLSEGNNGEIPLVVETEFDNNIKSFNGDRDITSVLNYFQERGINPELPSSTYNDMFTSSLLRSLRRGEEYKYGIVYYDSYGRRSDVKLLGKCTVPEIDYQIEQCVPFKWEEDKLVAQPVGIRIDLPQPRDKDGKLIKNIIGCQIVRRSSADIYLKTLLQVALARPVQLGLMTLNSDTGSEKKSPFYPTGFLTTNDIRITPPYYANDDGGIITEVANDGIDRYVRIMPVFLSVASKFDAYTRNKTLFLIFSSEINYRRDDVLERLNVSNTTIKEYLYLYPDYHMYGDLSEYNNSKRNYEKDLTFFGIIGEEVDSNSWDQAPIVIPQVHTQTTDLGVHPVWEVLTNIFHDTTEVKVRLTGNIPSNYFLFAIYDEGGQDRMSMINNGDDLLSNSTFSYCLRNNKNCKFLFKARYSTIMGGYYTVLAPAGVSLSLISKTVENINVNQKELTIHKDCTYWLGANNKQSVHWVFNYFNKQDEPLSDSADVKSVKDVKIPNWSDGFTNIQRDGENNIISAINKYKSFTTTIDQNTYNNWVSSCKYDFKAGCKQSIANLSFTDEDIYGEFVQTGSNLNSWLNADNWADTTTDRARAGYIGPGPSCFLMVTDKDFGTYTAPENRLYTSICNIQHNPKSDDVLSDEQTIYYGFGNYFKLIMGKEKYEVAHADGSASSTMVVFDGDIYITPHEFTTMYKTYNFESVDTLQSTQITNYIPLESKVNTYFDYGKNLLNTNSANLIYEPGQVEGIITLERPAHQYNMIYSDNDASNDIFTLISTDQNETNLFKLRAYFSEPKTNGEFIDNYQIFKPASFIDVDSKYGPITHLLTDKNSLYYWLETAFGKFSVNERSLINDTNGNTIMLGQAGILSRYDYISTKYGMREGDMCACPAALKIFWIDINNKAVVAGNGELAINYGEQLGVLNIINSKISEDRPYVHHDLLNDELLCKINKTEQLIFNTKYNIATSVYTRKYNDILDIKNHIYGLYLNYESEEVEDVDTAPHLETTCNLNITRYNYLQSTNLYLSPMELKFVVNPNASITKTFDNQQIVPIKRSVYKSSAVNSLRASFKTDLFDKVIAFNKDMWTDREGNILYAIPRWGNKSYGNRLKGKWMEVDFSTKYPKELTTISHIITKFRQSFS